MATNLTSKGQVTIPKRIRDSLNLQPGMPVEFDVNSQGEVVIRRAKPAVSQEDRFEEALRAVGGTAAFKFSSTDETMKFLRGDPLP